MLIHYKYKISPPINQIFKIKKTQKCFLPTYGKVHTKVLKSLTLST